VPAPASQFRRSAGETHAMGSHYVRPGYDRHLVDIVVRSYVRMKDAIGEASLSHAIRDGRVSNVFMRTQQYQYFTDQLNKTAGGEVVLAIRSILMLNCREYQLMPSITVIVIDGEDTVVVTLDPRG